MVTSFFFFTLVQNCELVSGASSWSMQQEFWDELFPPEDGDDSGRRLGSKEKRVNINIAFLRNLSYVFHSGIQDNLPLKTRTWWVFEVLSKDRFLKRFSVAKEHN